MNRTLSCNEKARQSRSVGIAIWRAQWTFTCIGNSAAIVDENAWPTQRQSKGRFESSASAGHESAQKKKAAKVCVRHSGWSFPLAPGERWASETRLTLGQVAVDAKSNEITAIPLLLELLELGAPPSRSMRWVARKRLPNKSSTWRPICAGAERQSASCGRRWPRSLPRRRRRGTAAGFAAARDGRNQPRPSPAPRMLRAASTSNAAGRGGLGKAGHDRDGAAITHTDRGESGQVSYYGANPAMPDGPVDQESLGHKIQGVGSRPVRSGAVRCGYTTSGRRYRRRLVDCGAHYARSGSVSPS